ncbi:MAG TPA: hypothetical protein VK892_22910 [Pyrinomonadaceae bacterium]|nr:hypothetical protein [Pyrinomonadaceae bacterium]
MLKKLFCVNILSVKSQVMKFAPIVLTLIFISLVNAQSSPFNPCLLKLSDAPTLRGLKLGMSPTEAEKIIGTKIVFKNYKRKFKYSGEDEVEVDVGIKRFDFPSKATKVIPSQLKGINLVTLIFFENSLYQIFVQYEKQEAEWKNSKEFTEFLSDRFNLPKESWFDTTYLSCGGFGLSAQVIEDGKARILLTDKETDNLVETKLKRAVESERLRRKNLEMEKEKGFKP